jgi:hypothetical protein
MRLQAETLIFRHHLGVRRRQLPKCPASAAGVDSSTIRIEGLFPASLVATSALARKRSRDNIGRASGPLNDGIQYHAADKATLRTFKVISKISPAGPQDDQRSGGTLGVLGRAFSCA